MDSPENMMKVIAHAWEFLMFATVIITVTIFAIYSVLRVKQYYHRPKHSKSRKEHYCDMCQVRLFPGVIHSVDKGIWVDRYFEVRLCLTCEKLKNFYERETGKKPSSYDVLIEWYEEKYCADCTSKGACKERKGRCDKILESISVEEGETAL